MANVPIRITVDSNEAIGRVKDFQREILLLSRGLGQTQAEAASIGIDELGRQIFKTAREAKRFGGIFADVNGRLHEASGEFASTAKSLGLVSGATADYSKILEGLQKNVEETTRVQNAYVDSQRSLSDFFRLARGEIGQYAGSVDRIVPSVDSLTESENALTAAIELNLMALEGFSGDAQELIDTYESLSDGLSSVAADHAILTAEVNLVNPAISSAVDSMRDYNVELSDAANNLQTVEEISDRVTASVRLQAKGFDELRASLLASVATFDLSESQRRQQRGISTPDLPGETINPLDLIDQQIGIRRTGEQREANPLEFAVQDVLENLGGVVSELTHEFSQLDGEVGDLSTKIGQFDIAGLASGNPLSIATLPFQLYNAFSFDQRQADATRPQREAENFERFNRGQFGIPTDLLEFGRGRLGTGIDAVQGSNAFTGDNREALLASLAGLDPVIGRTGLDDVSEIPQRIVDTIQDFTDRVVQELASELSQATFELDFARQSGGDVQGALQGVIGAQTALYQQQIDSYNLQRQATGVQIGNVDELNRILNRLNNETRLQLGALRPGPQNAQQFLAQNNITRGLAPGIDDQERGVVSTGFEDINTTEVIDPAIAELARFDADTGFEDNFNNFRNNINAATATIETINTEFTNFQESVLRPRFDYLRGLILDDDGVISAAEELALKEAGVFSFEDFSDPFREVADGAIMGIKTAETGLANYTAGSQFEQNVTAFGSSLTEAGNTIENINTAWQGFVENTLRPEFDRLRGLILDDDGITSAAEELVLRQAGVYTFEDFTGQFIGIKDAAVMGITSTETALANYVAGSGFESNVTAFGSSLTEAGNTIADVNVAWDNFIENTLRPEFDRLRGLILDDDGVISAAEELALRQVNVFTFDDFTGQFIGIKDAAVMGIVSTQTALANYIASSGFESNVNAFNSSIIVAGQTIEDVNVAWGIFIENTLRPEFERLRGLILDDDGIISTAEELALRQANVFTFEDFTSQYIGLRDSAITGIQNATRASQNASQAAAKRAQDAAKRARDALEALQTRTANRLANNALGAIRTAVEDSNATEAEIVQLWTDAQPFLETWYQELLDDANAIENVAERNEAVAALGGLPQFIANLKSQYVTPIISGLRRSAEALETRTANRLANTALQAIRTASEDVNVTETEIVNLWTVAQPALETWYNELLDDTNSIENDAERNEALAALGTPEAFIANLKSQYVTPIISGLRSSAEALETRTANRLANAVLGAIRTASLDVNITESAIVQLWTVAQPLLETWYGELLDDATSIENDAERTEALAALGTPEAFIANLRSQYVTPIVSRLRSSAEALETRTANRLANDALGAIRTASEDVNLTESEIVNLWETATPLILAWYGELLDDVNAIENDSERNEALAALGSPEAFIASLRSQYLTPVVSGLRRSGEVLETQTANRLASDALGVIGEAARGVNTTVDQILLLWNEARPAIVAWYNELRQDIETDISLSDAQRTEDLASLGTLSDFVSDIRNDTVAPFLNRLQSRGFQSRSNLGQNVLDRSRFLLSSATSQDEFDSERASLVRATNDYYDLEEDRISDLMSSEQELQNLREDNQLERIRALRDISNLEFRSAGSQLEDIQLGGARSREDLNISTERSIEDIIRENALDIGLAVNRNTGQADLGLVRSLSDQILGEFTGGRNIPVEQILSELGLDAFSEAGQQISELLNVDFRRAGEDLSLDARRQETDYLSQLATEESNNQWKSDIAAIAANTSQMDMLDPLLDPLLEPDSDRLDPLMPDTRDPLMDRTGLEGMEPDSDRIAFEMSLDTAGQSLSDSAAMLAASASHLMGAGDALYGSAAHLGSLQIPAPAGGGGVILMADGRQIATVVNDANVSLGASGGIVGGGGNGGNGGGGGIG